MWMRTTVTLTRRAGGEVRCDARSRFGQPGGRDLGERQAIVGASSFANRTRYPIPSGLLKAGVNVITTNIYCGWRDCGIRGPADTARDPLRAMTRACRCRIRGSTRKCPDGTDRTAIAVGIGSRRDARLQRDGPAGRRLHVPRRRVVSGRVGRALRHDTTTRRRCPR